MACAQLQAYCTKLTLFGILSMNRRKIELNKPNFLAETFGFLTSICAVASFLLMITSSELYASDGNPFIGNANPSAVDGLDLKVDAPTLDHGPLPVTEPIYLPADQTTDMQTVKGLLHRVAAIGGETTGWAIRLNKPLELSENRQVKKIEVDAVRSLLEPLLDKGVQARGRIVWRQGIERGRYPVMMLESIHEQ